MADNESTYSAGDLVKVFGQTLVLTVLKCTGGEGNDEEMATVIWFDNAGKLHQAVISTWVLHTWQLRADFEPRRRRFDIDGLQPGEI